MSKKLLISNGSSTESVPVVNKYTGTQSNYPIETTSELLDTEEKTYIEEITGNTIQDESDLTNIRSVGTTSIDGIYGIEIIQGDCPVEFGNGGRL